MAHQFRNPVFNAEGNIDMEYFFPRTNKWLPYTASADDEYALSRELFEQAMQGDVAPYVPKEEEQS